jgi:hypothetical protein
VQALGREREKYEKHANKRTISRHGGEEATQHPAEPLPIRLYKSTKISPISKWRARTRESQPVALTQKPTSYLPCSLLLARPRMLKNRRRARQKYHFPGMANMEANEEDCPRSAFIRSHPYLQKDHNPKVPSALVQLIL